MRRPLAWLRATLPVRTVALDLDRGSGNWAAAIALKTLLSLFPIVLAILFILSLVLRDPGNRDAVLGQIARVTPGGPDGEAFHEASGTLDAVRGGTGLLGIVGLGGLLWSGSQLFGCIEDAFSAVYGFTRRSFVRGKLMATAMILLFAVLTLVGVAASSALALLTPISERAGGDELLAGPSRYAIQGGIGLLSGAVLFGAIYQIVPRPRRRLGAVLPGALLAGAGFELLTLVFPLYLHLAGSGNRYGQTFGLVLVIVTYVYLLAELLMVGACLNAARESRAALRSAATEEAVPARPGALPTARARATPTAR